MAEDETPLATLRRLSRLGLSSKEIARHLGVSGAAVRFWWCGREPIPPGRVIPLHKLARAVKAGEISPGASSMSPEDIQAAIARSGLSRHAFAAAIGATPDAISEWLAGEDRPSRRHVEAIGKLLEGLRPEPSATVTATNLLL